MGELKALIQQLETERRALAEAGDTLACDLRSGWIGEVETTLALLQGARENELL